MAEDERTGEREREKEREGGGTYMERDKCSNGEISPSVSCNRNS